MKLTNRLSFKTNFQKVDQFRWNAHLGTTDFVVRCYISHWLINDLYSRILKSSWQITKASKLGENSKEIITFLWWIHGICIHVFHKALNHTHRCSIILGSCQRPIMNETAILITRTYSFVITLLLSQTIFHSLSFRFISHSCTTIWSMSIISLHRNSDWSKCDTDIQHNIVRFPYIITCIFHRYM